MLPLRRSGRRARLAGGSGLVRNVLQLVFATGARGWRRGWFASVGAMGSIALLTLITGLCILAALAVYHLSAAQARDASILHVYLREGADEAQKAALQGRLRIDSRVVWVKHVSKAEALSRASTRPGFAELVSTAGSNPLPESFDIRVRSLADVGGVADLVAADPAVDPAQATSYDGDVYQKLQFIRWVVASLAGGLLLVLCVVAAAVTASCVRAVLLARREEIEVMRLVGSPNWMIRGPFLVDGALTGTAGAAIGALFMAVLALAVLNSQRGSLSSFLPGISAVTVAVVAAVLVCGGAALGSLSALAGIRDLRR